MFGSGWTVKGRCCKKRPCCVFQCADIQSDSLPNGLVTLMERHVGSTASFSCNEGYLLDGNHSITCTQSGWNGETPQCRFQCEDIPPDSLTNGWNGSIPQCRLYILCPETTVDFRGSKYIFVCRAATWSDSEAYCNARAGHLTSIGTGDENTFLLDVLKLMQDIQKEVVYYWIGLTDNNDDMSYKWLSGEPLNYSDWYQGSPQQPDNLNFLNQPGAHCALIDEDYFLHWSDEPCDSLFGSICEIR
ncbi:Hypothetical predicted protein, partial [Mytilus galloprovincialis]